MPRPPVEKELLALEKAYWQALKERDVTTAVMLSDDPCIITGAQGVGKVDRQTMATMLRGARYTLDAFALSDDVQVRFLRDDVAVIAYRVHEELTVGGKAVTLEAADSSTWVRRNGSWVCALHTEALAGDPFGRDRQADGTVSIFRQIHANRERTFDAWLDPVKVSRWALTPASDDELVRVQLDARVNGEFSIMIARGGLETEHCGEYLVIERPRSLAFTYETRDKLERRARATQPLKVHVDFTEKNAHTETRVMIEHVPYDRIGATEAVWSATLEAIARSVERTSD